MHAVSVSRQQHLLLRRSSPTMMQKKNLNKLVEFLFKLLVTTLLIPPSASDDAITINTSLADGKTLVSAGEKFELGFFAGRSGRRYLGIWYKNIPVQTIVWVFNRETPLFDTTGVLKIDTNGCLVVVDGISNKAIWSSNSSYTNSSYVVAQLLDSGNFVLSNSSSSSNLLWQSFDYPSNTLLPGMKLGWNIGTGLLRFLNSWKNQDDPSVGDYSFKMDLEGLAELYMYHRSVITYRSGPWIGFQFIGVPALKSNSMLSLNFVSEQDEVYYTYRVKNNSINTMLVLSPSGLLQRMIWQEDKKRWNVFWSDPKDDCDDYAKCGINGVCDYVNSPTCNCLPGFNQKSPEEWALGDDSSGCMRSVVLGCEGDGFKMLTGMKFPDTRNATVNASMNIDECQQWCSSNCSCMAYASANFSEQERGCIIWTGDLNDLRKFEEEGGQDLFIRLAQSELDSKSISSTSSTSNERKYVSIIVPAIFLVILAGVCGYYIWKKIKAAKKTPVSMSGEHFHSILHGTNPCREYDSDEEGSAGKDLELQIFDIGTIAAATDFFSDENKLGEGGFGPVYRGKLKDGQDIAVKRLSQNSSQGVEEFKNEVRLIAKLQHRNLVRLLGCCIRGERMLIYEFMPNGSVDFFLFDKSKSNLLIWERRFTIILGIARGLLYLHQDSRLRIIHRDLKASNILLDTQMNPKISDFGMARMFSGDQVNEHTRRVVGTYGYMAPEYAMDGIFSVKSDVFSFGVLALEIVSGKKNRATYQSELYQNLLSYAWSLWKEGNYLEFVDETLREPYNVSEVERCIQVSLLCVQEQARDRPTMSEVVTMLSGQNISPAQPKQPGFSSNKSIQVFQSASLTSINGMSFTTIEGR